jgi:hypothetical protein
MSIERLAERLQAAYAAEDLTQLAPLLDDNVRWGDDDNDERTCHNRADVLAWYRNLIDGGMKGRVVEVIVQPDAVIMGLAITGPAPAGDHPTLVYQVHRVGNGQIIEIEGFQDRTEALAFAAPA